MSYLPEPTTAAEVMERAYAVQRRHMVPIRPVVIPLPSLPPPPPPPPEPAVALSEWHRKKERDRQKLVTSESYRMAMAQAERIAKDTASKAVRIVAEVAVEYGVPIAVIKGHQRAQEAIDARHEAIKRVALATGWSLPQIGTFFGGRDHTSIRHALIKLGVNYISKYYIKKYDPDIASRIRNDPRSSRALAAALGLSPTTIQNIRRSYANG